jgi:hypothetical protein
MQQLMFSARVKKLGINPLVDVPKSVVHALLKSAGKKNPPVQVKGILNKTPFLANVVKYAGKHRLYLNGQIRKAAQLGVGDRAIISLAYDPRRRFPPIPKELRQTLAGNRRMRQQWQLYPSSRKKEILLYLNSLKTRESLTRSINKVIRLLRGKASAR